MKLSERRMRLTLLFATAILATAATQAQKPSATSGHLVITGATLIDGSGRPARDGTTIVARDGRIAAVGSDRTIDLPKLGHMVLFLREGIAKDGVVPRSWLIGLAVALALAIMAAAFGLVRLPTAGVVTLFAPALLGLAIWKAGRQLARHTSEVLVS
jgi:hypothetical protein